MDIIGTRVSREEFDHYVKEKNFGMLPANKLVIHHTWKPRQEDWKGHTSIQGLKTYYESKGWSAGPHLFISLDGIWLFTDMRKNGIHAGKLNWRSIGIEVVGDYDNKVWEGETLLNALHAISTLKNHLKIPMEKIYFHRDVSAKSCPGAAITRKWLFENLQKYENGEIPQKDNWQEEQEEAWEWSKDLGAVSDKTDKEGLLSEWQSKKLIAVIKRIFDKKGL